MSPSSLCLRAGLKKCTALAATIGVGNISGVAAALTSATFESVFGTFGGRFISVAVMLLSGQVVQMTREYIANMKSGKESIDGENGG